MSRLTCPACALRFKRPGPPVCPECEGPLVRLQSCDAMGLQLFVDAPEISLSALSAAIAAARPPDVS